MERKKEGCVVVDLFGSRKEGRGRGRGRGRGTEYFLCKPRSNANRVVGNMLFPEGPLPLPAKRAPTQVARSKYPGTRYLWCLSRLGRPSTLVRWFQTSDPFPSLQ